jgi:hypothetical protein
MPALTVNNTEPTDSATGFKQKSSNDFPAIQEGVYEAEVARMQYRSKAEFEAEGKTWPAWKKHDAEINIGFRLIDQSITKGWFWLEAPFAELNSQEGTKLRIVLQELTGFDKLPETFVFDTDELEEFVGFDCRLRINYYFHSKTGEAKNSVREVLRSLNATGYTDASDIF